MEVPLGWLCRSEPPTPTVVRGSSRTRPPPSGRTTSSLGSGSFHFRPIESEDVELVGRWSPGNFHFELVIARAELPRNLRSHDSSGVSSRSMSDTGGWRLRRLARTRESGCVLVGTEAFRAMLDRGDRSSACARRSTSGASRPRHHPRADVGSHYWESGTQRHTPPAARSATLADPRRLPTGSRVLLRRMTALRNDGVRPTRRLPSATS